MLAVFSPAKNVSAARSLCSLMKKRRSLIYELARRDLVDQYAGQYLGTFWSYVHPIFLMLVYGFVFNVVYQTRLPEGMAVSSDFSAYLFAGLIPWMSAQAAMAKGGSLVIAHSNLIKQVVFPTEVIPVKTAVAAMFPFLLSLTVLIIYIGVRFGFSPLVLALPLLIACQFALVTGLIMAVGAIAVFVRDVREIVTMFALAGVFFLPIIYLPQWVPASVRPILYMNPFSYMVWCYQDVFFFGSIEHPASWILFPLISLTILLLGFRLFLRLQSHFADAM